MQKEVSNRVGVETKNEEKEEMKEVMVPYLPSNIMYEILSWLPFQAMMRFRCVCKAWCELPKDPSFVELQSSRSEILQHPPYVVVDGNLNMFYKSIMNGTWGRMNIPHDVDTSRGTYLASCNGLICTRVQVKHPDVFYLVYNPITREKIRLPKFKISRLFGYQVLPVLGFGFDKTNNNYKLILDAKDVSRESDGSEDESSWMESSILDSDGSEDESSWMDLSIPSRESDCFVPIITIGESSWRKLSIPCGMKEFFDKKVGVAVFFNEGLHWAFGRKDNNNFSVEGILELDIFSEKFQTIMFSTPFEIDKQARPIQFGNSIGFFHLIRGEVINIWKLLGPKDDGSCEYQCKTILYHEIIPFSRFYDYDLLTVLCNGEYVFKMQNYLVVYNQDKSEYSHIEFVDLYRNPTIAAFMPTLLSPHVPQGKS